jgi:uncharacterized membrane protein YqiK
MHGTIDFIFLTIIGLSLIIVLVLIIKMIVDFVNYVFFPQKNVLTEGVVIGKEYEEEHDEEESHTRLILMGKTLMPITNSETVHVPTKYTVKVKGDDGTVEVHEVSKTKFDEAEIYKRIKL